MAFVGFPATFIPSPNRGMLGAFQGRPTPSWVGRVCRPITVGRIVEPFEFLGAAPGFKAYVGNLDFPSIPVFQLYLPTRLFRTGLAQGRRAMEQSQIPEAHLAIGQAFGPRLQQLPMKLIARLLMQGSTANSQIVPDELGINRTVTFDGQPLFATTHGTITPQTAGSQSNILTGALPNGVTNSANVDIAAMAQLIQRDIPQILDMFATFTDGQGEKIHSDIAKGSLTILCPPSLVPAFKLAISGGSIGGANGTTGSSGSTPTIGQDYIGEVVGVNYFSSTNSLTDPMTDAPAKNLIGPVNSWDYFVIKNDDRVPAIQLLTYRPPTSGPGDMESRQATGNGPLPYVPDAGELEFARLNNISIDQVSALAGTEIVTNIGQNSQYSVQATETYHTSARAYMAAHPGFWFNAIKVKPTGGT